MGESDGPNVYSYVRNNPINMVDPNGLWGIGWVGANGQVSWNIGWGDPTLAFSNESADDLRRGAAATADGFIPFADPFQDQYDPCDWDTGVSKALGALSRDLLLTAAVPNIGTWAKNPVLYEIGQKTLPAAEWARMGNLSPIARGGQIVAEQGWARALTPTLTPSSYGPTIGTGLTPGGWLGVIGVGQAADSATW
jgi:hypothetical protein